MTYGSTYVKRCGVGFRLSSTNSVTHIHHEKDILLRLISERSCLDFKCFQSMSLGKLLFVGPFKGILVAE